LRHLSWWINTAITQLNGGRCKRSWAHESASSTPVCGHRNFIADCNVIPFCYFYDLITQAEKLFGFLSRILYIVRVLTVASLFESPRSVDYGAFASAVLTINISVSIILLSTSIRGDFTTTNFTIRVWLELERTTLLVQVIAE